MPPKPQDRPELQETPLDVVALKDRIGRKSESGERKIWRAGTLVYTTGGLVFLFVWLLWGDFAWSLKERSISQVVQILLIKFGSSDVLSGFLLGSLPAAMAMFLGPIIGYKSDRHRGRWGRRIPFILAPTPLVVISMIGLAFSPALGKFVHNVLGSHSPGLNFTVMVFLAFCWTLFAFSSIIVNSVFGALVNDVVPSPVLGRFYGAFRALSLGAGILFSYWILGRTEAHYLLIFIGIGVFYAAGLLLMCWKVKEGEYPPPTMEAPSRGVIKGFVKACISYVNACFGKPYYVLVFFVISIPACAFLPFNLFSLFYAKSLHMSMDEFGKCNAIMYCISFALSYPIGALADRIHPIRIGIAILVVYALAALWGGAFVHDKWTFTIAFFAFGIIVGVWLTATASLPQRLLPADKFAEYSSAAGIINCLCQIIIGPALGFLLDYTHHVYRYVFFVTAAITGLCLWACIALHKRFMALGGPEHYVAPE